MGKKDNLTKAKRNKNDEFYTRIEDIEKELMHYKEHFKGKTIFCNCDDPEYSNFWQYFNRSFEHLGIKRLLATHYEDTKQSYMLEMYKDEKGVHTNIKTLKQNGDFRSPECIELLKQADIVVTNPPFSLFREYISQLMEYKKKFVILGNMNAITYKEFFPLLKNNEVWTGYKSFGGGMNMIMPNDIFDKDKVKKYSVDTNGRIIVNIMGVIWFTNLDIPKRHEDLLLYKTYSADEFPNYDNYKGINVNKVTDIPYDYNGIIGVPITFIDKYNPEQFEILGLAPERLSEGDSKLQIKRYENAVQHNKDGSIQSGNKVNDGPVIAHNQRPPKFPYYTSDTAPNKYLEVLYARILIKRKCYD